MQPKLFRSLQKHWSANRRLRSRNARFVNPQQPLDLQRWFPEELLPTPRPNRSRSPPPSPLQSLSVARRLSPIARFILDAFRKNKGRWGPEVVAELTKLRRVTPNLVTEVVKIESNPTLATRFFHWAAKQKGYNHTYACYNALAYCLNRGRMFRAADQLPELMDSQGKPPSEKQFEILIRMHSDSGRGLRVHYVYEKMKKFGIKPRVFLYNRIMETLVKTGYLDLALSVYEDFKSDGLVEENVTFMILVKGLCKAGRIEEMVNFLSKMRGSGCRPDIFAYTSMIRILVDERHLDGCLKVWKEMKCDEVEPDAMAYVTYVSGLRNAGLMDEAFEIFKEMKAKGIMIDRIVYWMLVDGFVKQGKVKVAIDLFQDLVNSGYIADLKIYRSIIEGLCKSNQVDSAHKLFKALVKEGIPPDFGTVCPMLLSYAEVNRFKDIHNLLLQMEKLDFSISHNLPQFFSMMTGEDRTSLALNVFETLKDKGYCNVSIYNILMEALLKQGRINQALSLFKEMNDLGPQPDSTTYSTAIVCYVENGNIKEACEIYNKIIDISCIPSVAAFLSLAKGLSDVGEIDSVMLLVRECLANVPSGPMEFKYCLTIRHACRSANADKIIEIFNDLMHDRCPLDGIICSAIISGMCEQGTVEEARKLFVTMKQRKLLTEAKAVVYTEILMDHAKRVATSSPSSETQLVGREHKLRPIGLLPT